TEMDTEGPAQLRNTPRRGKKSPHRLQYGDAGTLRHVKDYYSIEKLVLLLVIGNFRHAKIALTAKLIAVELDSREGRTHILHGPIGLCFRRQRPPAPDD